MEDSDAASVLACGPEQGTCGSSSCLHSHPDLLPSVLQGSCVSPMGMGGIVINAKVALPFEGGLLSS